MPCDNMAGYDAGHSAQSDVNKLRKEFDVVKKELDTVTRFLCQVLRSWKPEDLSKLDPEVQRWFIQHIEWDRQNGRL